MLRSFLLFLKLAALVLVAVWVVRRPGLVSIDWEGYRLTTSVGVALLALLLLLVAVVLGYRLWRAVIGGPDSLRRRRQEARRARGYRALTRALVAVAAGDVEAAKRQTRAADALLNDVPLALLLQAQMAQLAGDEASATRHCEAMLKRTDTEFLGLKGLLTQALHAGDQARALTLARRAQKLAPKAPWPAEARFELEARARDWDAALSSLDRARRAGHNSRRLRHHRAALLVERSRHLERTGSIEEALVAARQAHDEEPGLEPAAAALIRLQLGTDNRRAATRTLLQAWRAGPHPELASLWGSVEPGGELARVKRFEALLEQGGESAESHFALGRACLEAKLWGQARSLLERALALAPERRVHLALADLARATGRDAEAQQWLAKSAQALADPAWLCRACGATLESWGALCPACGGFDTAEWRSAGAAAQSASGNLPALRF